MDDAYRKELLPFDLSEGDDQYEDELDEDAMVDVADVGSFTMDRLHSQSADELRYRHPLPLETVEAVLTHEPDLKEYFTDRMEGMDDPDEAPYAYLAINPEGKVRAIGLGVAEDDPHTGHIMDGRLDRPAIRAEHIPRWIPAIEAGLRGYADAGELHEAWEDVVRDPDFSLIPNPRRYF